MPELLETLSDTGAMDALVGDPFAAKLEALGAPA
jgi:hypothetical protein